MRQWLISASTNWINFYFDHWIIFTLLLVFYGIGMFFYSRNKI